MNAKKSTTAEPGARESGGITPVEKQEDDDLSAIVPVIRVGMRGNEGPAAFDHDAMLFFDPVRFLSRQRYVGTD